MKGKLEMAFIAGIMLGACTVGAIATVRVSSMNKEIKSLEYKLSVYHELTIEQMKSNTKCWDRVYNR